MFRFMNQFFQGLNMFFESYFSQGGGGVIGIRFSAHKTFFHQYILSLFQSFYVAGQITVGNIQQFLQPIKIRILIHNKNTHNTQPDAVIK